MTSEAQVDALIFQTTDWTILQTGIWKKQNIAKCEDIVTKFD